ncbi:hypothetical protein [Agrobacterium sp. NPDC090273]|uniref:hypothetical protein n=1 Tax=Agrobacterium sp. NPDC090273 TaxID=3363919 RepID=UPI00383B8307
MAACFKECSQMHGRFGLYYRMQSELRRREATETLAKKREPMKKQPAPSDFFMLVRLMAVVGGLLLAVSVVMNAIQ